jgi:hypothetical protein
MKANRYAHPDFENIKEGRLDRKPSQMRFQEDADGVLWESM